MNIRHIGDNSLSHFVRELVNKGTSPESAHMSAQRIVSNMQRRIAEWKASDPMNPIEMARAEEKQRRLSRPHHKTR